MVSLINKHIKHTGALGVGTVTEQDDRYITVEFASKTCKFAYPTAFEKFLVALDPADAEEIKKELEEAKAAVEAAKRAVEEQAKLKSLRAQAAAFGKKASIAKVHVPVKRVAGQAMTYLVFQGDTYNEERTGQFIWAPKFTKDGRTMHHWERLLNVREGDVIFHCSNGYIQAISHVIGSCAADKYKEIKAEMRNIYEILEKFEKMKGIKTLPLTLDKIELTGDEISKLEAQGYLKISDEKYYLPEIIRLPLGFTYERGARPKVLSLLVQ